MVSYFQYNDKIVNFRQLHLLDNDTVMHKVSGLVPGRES